MAKVYQNEYTSAYSVPLIAGITPMNDADICLVRAEDVEFADGKSIVEAIEDGTLSGMPYQLPTASATVLGGVKVGKGLSMDAATGTLSATAVSLEDNSVTTEKIVDGAITIDKIADGVIPDEYVLSPATAAKLGGIIVGSGLSVAANGTLSVPTISSETVTSLWNANTTV